MAKYRKKPMMVDAEVYKPGMEDGFDCEIRGCPCRGICKGCEHSGKPYIQTLEGRHFISEGDYIVTTMKGRYPYKPDIFYATYELVLAEE